MFQLVPGYQMARLCLLNLRRLFHQGYLYAILSLLVVVSYGLMVTGASLIIGEAFHPTNPFVVGLMVLFLALFLNPIRNQTQKVVDGVFHRGNPLHQERLQSFGRELPEKVELPEILALLHHYIQDTLQPEQLHIFIHDPKTDQYAGQVGLNGNMTTDLLFPGNSSLVARLSQRRGVLHLDVAEGVPEEMRFDRARLALLGCELFSPLPGKQRLAGWVALSNTISGEKYTRHSLEFLQTLCDQTALAVERAQVVSDLERRIHEMNILTRVAQGTNFTLHFDDILELIYAQTNQVIPTLDFSVALYDRPTDMLNFAFFLENDERITERENRPMPRGQWLEGDVVRSQRELVTEDYVGECRGRGVLPANSGLYAWMAVPLNAGAETIGAVSLGSRDPAIFYTMEQKTLFQAIADQAAGAIIKARLLAETETRAHQLAKLNEIGRGLTSTLDVKTLLRRILTSACQIINTQAGRLFLVDPDTGDLVVEAVVGLRAEITEDRRLPADIGVAEQAVHSGKAIISNDSRRRRSQMFGDHHGEIALPTQDLLAVPMVLQDREIGVIEVINKVDGSHFGRADQDLLTAFASQATIAVENARLYTMTDQALAARVEELSVMQRVDRELNASLDVRRALEITLGWAMRQSRTEAGLLGLMESDGIRVMSAEGYGEEILPYWNGGARNDDSRRFLPRELLAQAQEGGTTSPEKQSGNGRLSLLPGMCSQVVVPIQREGDVIGILLLESKGHENYSEDTISFLTRLSDHAAIAIANARLYEEVQMANMAKSKFVSFVAHELKNPMSSIKGYTELVAGGMAGPVTEMQASFLATVKANVDRMNKIVTDLNDLTKIQVGSLRLDFQTVRVQDVIADVVHSMQQQIHEKEQHVEVLVPEGLPDAWADPMRLEQIVTNLLSNAHKYTGQGGNMCVRAEHCRRVQETEAQMASALEVVHVWVEDDGIGISEEDQQHIFEQYFRTDVSKEMAAGTGLGLNITRSLVLLQGGQIWFESKPGAGTTFHFTIPMAETG